MASNANDEEIIEKGPSSPIASSCLILACLATLGALIFQFLEISEVRAGLTDRDQPYKKLHDRNLKEFKDAVEKVIADNDHPGIGAGGKAAADETAPPGGEGEKAATEGKVEGAAEPAPAGEPGKAESSDTEATPPPADDSGADAKTEPEAAPEPPPAEGEK